MKTTFLLFLNLSIVSSVFAFSTSDHLAKKYVEIGNGKLSYYFWDVYHVTYSKSEDKTTEIIKLKYLRDIDKDLTQRGWDESLSHLEKIDPQLNWLKSKAVDVVEGDEIEIFRVGKENIFITKNRKVIASKEKDQKLNSIIHYPWIGKKSINKKLKKQLLKN